MVLLLLLLMEGLHPLMLIFVVESGGEEIFYEARSDGWS